MVATGRPGRRVGASSEARAGEAGVMGVARGLEAAAAAQGGVKRWFDASAAWRSFPVVTSFEPPLSTRPAPSTGATVPAAPDEPKDLGFGSVVGGARQQRLVNRDGSFTSRRV